MNKSFLVLFFKKGLLALKEAAALLPFGCGALACLALQHGLFANGTALALAGLWAALSRGPRAPAQPMAMEEVAAPPPMPGDDTERGRLRVIMDQIPVPLLTRSADGVLQALNRAARAMFGTDDRIVMPPPGLTQALGEAVPGRRSVVRLPARPGAEPVRSYALSVAHVAGAGGPVLLGVLTDIQAELQAMEAAALRDVLQVLSHEIMNSLTPVTSLAESAYAILREEGVAGVTRATEALDVILRRARGLDGFVAGYRTLSRLPPPHPAAGSVNALLDDAASLFRSRWGSLGIALEVERAVPDAVALFDADQMAHALLNLLANAAEAAQGQAMQGQGGPRVRLSATVQTGAVELRVGDNGAGVSAGQEEAIFRPFFTLKPGGSGIGLTLARQIALAHGGSLTVRTCEVGAMFVLRF